MDDAGVKWPENVVLKGDAKEFLEATVMYKKEYEMRRDEEQRGYLGRWRI